MSGESAKSVEKVTVAARVQKASIVMLTMQFDKRVRQCAQHLARYTPIVDERGFPSIARIDAPQDQVIGARKPGLFQKGPGGMIGRDVELGRDFALLGACAHKIGAPAPPQHEAQRIKQDRFAGPGLAGQHIQTRLEVKRQPVDDEHIPDVEASEHPARSSGVRATRRGWSVSRRC